ncbi:MAG: recombination mediator protein UvsY [Legionella sp.]|uniref:recombination mediator protein UvsY n=1 Tax=Legionella sp. TaxID=459 RepID=UPI00284196F4|nr:recombination mediator protein UvsY [Legionella sp.]
MKFEEIISNWNEDCEIDRTDLANASLGIAKLHSKYYQIYLQEKGRLFQLDTEYKKLECEKYIFYTEGHTEETRKKGWELPPRGAIIKSEVQRYLDCDPDIVTKSKQIGIVKDKTDFLKEIIQNINNRSFHIKNAISYMQWSQGSG